MKSAHEGSQVLCLPRNLHIEVHTVPRGSQSAAPATKSAHQAPVPSRRQGVHPTPGPAASAAHSTQMLPAECQCPADARAYIRPLGKLHMEVHKVLCLPRKLHTEVHKVLRLPRNLRMKVHEALRLPRNLHIKRRCPADARAYIRPLGKQQAPHTVHMEVHKVLCLPRDLRTEVHKVLRLPRNLHMKVHKVLRLPRNLHIKHRCPADARAYIRPLGKQQAPHTARKCYRQSAGAQPTPARTSDPLASSKVLCLPRDLRTEVHKVLRLPRNLHMKVHKVLRLPRNLHIQRRCPADARAYIRPLGKQQSAVLATRSAHGGSQSTAPATKSAREGSQSAAPATKSAHQAPVPSRRQAVHPATRSAHGDSQSTAPARKCPADARAYIRPLGKQQSAVPARDLRTEVHKVLRLPRNLHMKVHKVLRLPRNLHIKRRCPADARAYIRP